MTGLNPPADCEELFYYCCITKKKKKIKQKVFFTFIKSLKSP